MKEQSKFLSKRYTTDITPNKFPRLWGVCILIDAFFVSDGGGDHVDLTGTYCVPASKPVVRRAEDQLRERVLYGDIISLCNDHWSCRNDTEAGAILNYLFEAQWSTIEE